MKLIRCILFVSLNALCGFSFCQVPAEMSQTLEDKIESVAGDDDQGDFSAFTENVEELARHPFNICNGNMNDFRKSGLFNDVQLKAIEEHVRSCGPFIALEELQQVDGFSYTYIRSLLPYICCKTSDLKGKDIKTLSGEGDHYFIYRVQRVLEQKAGYAGAPYSVYKGSSFGSLLRYRYTLAKHISLAFTAEKDPGEEFFAGSNPDGFDFYSFHVALKQMGRLNMLVVGDYQLCYGQGLTLNTGNGGFSGDPVFVKRNLPGIKPYSSTGESGFQRGAALSVTPFKNSTLDLFVSKHNIDANIRSDTDSLFGNATVSSLQTSGYHRTWWEIEDKGAITERMGGGRLAFSNSSGAIGLTFVHAEYSIPVIKTPHPYNRFDFSGTAFSRGGIDCWKLVGNIVFFGEVARSSNDATAFLAGLMVSADRFMSFSLSARMFDRDFIPVYTGASGQRSQNANEQGIYAGITFNLNKNVLLSGSCDSYIFPWLTYYADAPSKGREINVRLSWQPSRKSELYIRYRSSCKSSNDTESDLPLQAITFSRYNGWRLHAGYQLSRYLTMKTRVELLSVSGVGKPEQGMLFLNEASWRPLQSPWQVTLRYAWFETTGYGSRIYAYEADVPGSYSVPAYYYTGSRIYVLVRFNFSSALSAWLKYAVSVYENRDHIGSGYEEIEGSVKSEIKLQFRYTFGK
ncbi:MAG TPA: hypothetical protein VFW78_08185 [Bacteroidia bacterium]|nr:hypothetical protein [Bacteroidia bacterium]